MTGTLTIFHRVNQAYQFIETNIGGSRSFACLKDGEQFVAIVNSSEDRINALRTFGRWASNLELRFCWFDAAIMSQRIRQEKDEFRVGEKVVRIAE